MLKHFKFALPIAFALSITSCREANHKYIQFQPVSGQSWSYADTAVFETVVSRDGKYNLFVSIRHEKEYEFSNVWLKISEPSASERVDVPLFNLQGKPLGKCSSGLCTQTVFWKEIEAQKGDTLSWRVVQNMRKDPLKHISEIGLMLDPVADKNQ
jgi:gliding motility-associated lipoprotein GldH